MAQVRSANRRIFNAMVVVASVTFVAKLMLTARDLALAARFGTSDALDAYLIALMVPLYAVGVLAASFTPAFVPEYVRVRRDGGNQAAARLFESVQLVGVVLLILVTALLAATFPLLQHVVAGDFPPDKIALTRRLFFVLLPVVLVSGVSAMWTGVMNAAGRFAVPAAVPIIMPLVPVVFLLTDPTPSAQELVIVTIIGYGAEMALLAVGLHRLNLLAPLRWNGWTPELRQVARQYLPVVSGTMMLGTTILVDQAMAATLGSGEVSALNYGMKVTSFTLGVGAIALSTAVLPHFSEFVASGDWVQVRRTLRTYTRLAFLVTLPLSVVAALLSRPIVTLLFQHGRFTSADTADVSDVQALFILQVPFYLVGVLVVRLISSLNANRHLFWGAIISATLNVSLNWFLMARMGVAGIALSTTFVYVTSSAYLGFVALKLLAAAERPR